MLISFGRVVVVAYMILVSSSVLPFVRVGPGLNNKYILCRDVGATCNLVSGFKYPHLYSLLFHFYPFPI